MAFYKILGEETSPGVYSLLADEDGRMRGRLTSLPPGADLPSGIAVLNQTIYIDDPDAKAWMDPYLERDIIPILNAMTGVTFVATTTDPEVTGIVRVENNSELPFQGYRITAEPEGDVLIEGGRGRGCINGLYAWLESLGWRQLLPTSRWEIVPHLVDLRQSLSTEVVAPKLRTLHWFVQGGSTWPIGGLLGWQTAWFTWFDRTRRPLGDYTTALFEPQRQAFGGHSEPEIYSAKKALFDADPEHFKQFDRDWRPNTLYRVNNRCTNGGNRYIATAQGTSASSGGPTGTGTGITDGGVTWNFVSDQPRLSEQGIFHSTHDGQAAASDPPVPEDYDGVGGVLGIQAEWVGERVTFNAANAGLSHDGCSNNVSVAVHDGAIQCQDAKCYDLLRTVFSIDADATASDLSFWRASRVSQIAHAANPGIDFEVFDYAYDLQSAPPTPGWQIDPNVHVMLAQWRYAVDGLPGRVLLEKWKERSVADGFPLSAYDYWALPAHTSEDPRDGYALLWDRYRYWLDAEVTAVTGESSCGSGAIGLQWWGMLQMAWRGQTSNQELLSEFCDQAFGAASGHMQDAYAAWQGRVFPVFLLMGWELALAYHAMAAADVAAAAAEDDGARSRVAAMQAYFIWLHYKRKRLQNPTDEVNLEALFKHIWKMADSYVLNSKFIHDVYINQPGVSPEFFAKWSIPASADNYPAWIASNGLTQYADSEIRTLFASIASDYPAVSPATWVEPDWSSIINAGTPSGTTPITHNLVWGDEGHPYGHEYVFEVKAGATGVLRIAMTAQSVPALMRFRLYNAATGDHVSTQDVPLPMWFSGDALTNHDFDLSAMTPGYYRLFVENSKTTIRHQVICATGVPIVRIGAFGRVLWQTEGGFARYFPVPPGTTAFHYWASGGAAAMAFADGDNTTVSHTEIYPGVLRVVVPSGQDGRWWRMTGNPGSGFVRLLDIPNIYAPTRAQGICPANLVSPP